MFKIPNVEDLKSQVLSRKDTIPTHFILKYAGLSIQCICCQSLVAAHESSEAAPSKSPVGKSVRETDYKSRGEKSPQISSNAQLLLYRLGLCKELEMDQLPLEKTNDNICLFTLMKFVECFSTNRDGPVIHSFDLDAMNYVFDKIKTRDEFIIRCIDRILSEKCVYAPPNDSLFFNILILGYAYLKVSDPSLLKSCKARIEELSMLFKPSRTLLIDFQDDASINPFVLGLRRTGIQLSDAIFLNKMYLSRVSYGNGRHKRSSNDISFGQFHARLSESVKQLQHSNLLSFLKHVFAYSTVLFTCLKEPELYRLIVSFYEKNKQYAPLVSLLELLITRILDDKINEYLSTKYLSIIESTPQMKYSTSSYWHIFICRFRAIDEYHELFIKNSNNSIAIRMGLEGLQNIYRAARRSHAIETSILRILFTLFNEGKIQQISAARRMLFNLLTETLKGAKIESVEFQDFIKFHWNNLSKVVLTLQRLDVAEVEGKKKKRSAMHLSGESKATLSLIKIIRDIEQRANITVGRLRTRGFRIQECQLSQSE